MLNHCFNPLKTFGNDVLLTADQNFAFAIAHLLHTSFSRRAYPSNPERSPAATTLTACFALSTTDLMPKNSYVTLG